MKIPLLSSGVIVQKEELSSQTWKRKICSNCEKKYLTLQNLVRKNASQIYVNFVGFNGYIFERPQESFHSLRMFWDAVLDLPITREMIWNNMFWNRFDKLYHIEKYENWHKMKLLENRKSRNDTYLMLQLKSDMEIPSPYQLEGKLSRFRLRILPIFWWDSYRDTWSWHSRFSRGGTASFIRSRQVDECWGPTTSRGVCAAVQNHQKECWLER